MVIVSTLEMPVFEDLSCIVTKGNLLVGLGKWQFMKNSLSGFQTDFPCGFNGARFFDIEGAFESQVYKKKRL